jgi:hypothetical protein
MIVTDQFVFLHLHKSGGTFILKFLQEHELSARMIGYHLPYAELPAGYRERPVLGSVRNPWSYYVSWYTFQSGMDNPNPLFRVVSDNCRLDFNATITNLVTLADSQERLDSLGQVLPRQFQPRGLNLTRNCIKPLYGSGTGFYTFLFNRMFDGCTDPHIVRMESMREEFVKVLPALGRNLTTSEAAFFSTEPATNTTEHAHFTEYYSDRLRDLVAEKDAATIERFGYAFG